MFDDTEGYVRFKVLKILDVEDLMTVSSFKVSRATYRFCVTAMTYCSALLLLSLRIVGVEIPPPGRLGLFTAYPLVN